MRHLILLALCACGNPQNPEHVRAHQQCEADRAALRASAGDADALRATLATVKRNAAWNNSLRAFEARLSPKTAARDAALAECAKGTPSWRLLLESDGAATLPRPRVKSVFTTTRGADGLTDRAAPEEVTACVRKAVRNTLGVWPLVKHADRPAKLSLYLPRHPDSDPPASWVDEPEAR